MTDSTRRRVDASGQKLSLPVSAGSQETTRQLAEASATSIRQYNVWAMQRKPSSQHVRRWREQERLNA